MMDINMGKTMLRPPFHWVDSVAIDGIFDAKQKATTLYT